MGPLPEEVRDALTDVFGNLEGTPAKNWRQDHTARPITSSTSPTNFLSSSRD